MPLGFGGVFGLGHASNGQLLQDVLLGLALNLIHQLVERSRDFLRLRGVHRVAKALRKAREGLQSIQIWAIVRSVHKGVHALIFAENKFGHILVGQEHKLFDELVNVFSLLYK